MGSLSFVLPTSDPRLVPGAYVSRGVSLYRVHRRTASQVTLEDAFTETISATSADDVLANYLLARSAPTG
jgi:hypothetical protein